MPYTRVDREPIAVVGIGCRFPMASGPEAFWRLIEDGVDAISEIPADRFDVDALYDPRPGTPGKISTRWGGFLDQIDRFDAAFFRISPREADRLDPQQRLLLEVACEALDDAGQTRERLAGTRAGVFVGLWLNDFEARLFRDPAAIDFYMTTGSGRYSASGRISYALDFEGPSVTVDTACSSSLVGVHLACQSLRLGESTIALAGGANVILEPNITLAYSQSNMMAIDGRCKFGDARANGYVRSEGAGLVVLKRLSDAVADRDRIYAVILGSAVNNDGGSSGFLATPAQHGQEQLLRHAYRDAGVSPGRVQYVEAHGTGTQAGDPVEIGALGTVLADGRAPDNPCRIGSVKTNIGHTEGAAGVAGLIKTALALHKQTVPANLHFETPNPAIPWDRLPVAISNVRAAWRSGDGAPIAGVSAFGIAGTNAHVVLQAWTEPEIAGTEKAVDADGPQLLTLSANTPDSLRELAAAYVDRLAGRSTADLADICYTASARRTHHEHRLACVARNGDEAAEQLGAWMGGEQRPRLSQGRRSEASAGKAAFVFPGQGSQWIGMGRRLMAEQPVVRQTLVDCDAAIREWTGWSLLEELAADEGESRLDRIDVIQPCIFSMQVALAALWRSWGIEPAAVVGHSMGEVAAAYVAGALPLRDAARIICRRSRLLRRTSGQGAMAVVELTIDEATAALAGYGDRVSVAVSNSPRSTVLSGDPSALDEIIASLERREVFCRRVKVDVASHSPQMDPLRADLLEELQGIEPRVAQVPFYSTVTGAPETGAGFDPKYWVRNLREPVLFFQTVQRLTREGHTLFIEMSPHPILVPAVQEILQHGRVEGAAIGSLRRGEDEQAEILGALGAAYAFGKAVDWSRVYPAPRPPVALPAYPWQRERYWYDSGRTPAPRSSAQGDSHPLLGRRMPSAIHDRTHFWHAELTPEQFADVESERFALSTAAALLDAAAAAVGEVHGGDATLARIEIDAYPDVGAALTLQTVLSPSADGTPVVRILSASAADATASGWTPLLSAVVARDEEAANAPVDFEAIRARCTAESSARTGVIAQMRRGADEALARLAAPDAINDTQRVPPILIAAALDVLSLASAPDGAAPSTIEPLGIDGFRVRRAADAGRPVWCHATHVQTSGNDVTGDVRLVTDGGEVVAEMTGARVRRLPVDPLRDALYAIEWQSQAVAATTTRRDARGGWLILSDRGGVGERLAARLARAGEACTVASAADDYRAALQQPLRGIVHLGSLDLAVADGAAILDGDLDRNGASVLDLVHAVVAAASTPSPRVVLVTGGVQAIGANPGTIAVAQAPVWGLGSAIAAEHPEFACLRVDLSASPSDREIDALVRELRATGDESQVALRGGDRYVARLVRWHPRRRGGRRAATGARDWASGTYVITGGVGALGLSVATWMAEQGARHLVLMSRRGMTAEASAAVDALGRLGASAVVVSADVSRSDDVATALEQVRSSMPPLRGIVHAAGVVDDGILLQLDGRRLASVMASKARGAWNLHAATREDALEFFVMFSSVASFLISAGHGNYAAANAFLDAFADYRRTLGCCATAINWGPWGERGLAAAQADRLERLAERGLDTLPTADGLAALACAIEQAPTRAAVMHFDATRWCAADGATSSAFFARLLDESASGGAVVEAQAIDLGARLAALASGPERRACVEDFVQAEVARVLRLAPSRIDPTKPFRTMGLDSLMGLELRNRLEPAVGIRIPATLVWNYPTVVQFAAQLAERMGVSVDDKAPDAASVDAAVDVAALLSEIEELSDEDARRLLAE